MGSRRDFIRDGLVVAGASALGGCTNLLKTETPADTLIVNGRIATLNPRQPNAEAIAIRGERIVAVGTELPVRHYGGYYKKAAASAASEHPMIISDAGNWSIECSCGGI